MEKLILEKINDTMIYTIYSCISGLMLALCIPLHFFGEYTDGFLTVLKILICAFCFYQLEQNNHTVASLKMKMICVVEALLFLVFLGMSELTPFVFKLITFFYIAIFVLETLFYVDLLKEANRISKYKINKKKCEELEDSKMGWVYINMAIVPMLIVQYLCRFGLLIILVTVPMALYRFILKADIVSNTSKVFCFQGPERETFNSRPIVYFEKDEEEEKRELAKKKLHKCFFWGTLSFLIVSFLFLRFSYKWESPEDGMSEIRDSVYRYHKVNRMPEWTGFYSEKYGYLDKKTGEDTGIKYNHELKFINGKAWDYNGHFIDLHGNVVLDVPFIVSAKLSSRQKYLGDILTSMISKYV